MKNFVYQKKKISLVKRVRISENRDLKKGLRLNRNERVDNFPNKILSKIFSKVQDYDLGKYPDQTDIYKSLSKFTSFKDSNLQITSGIDGSIKSILKYLQILETKLVCYHQHTQCMKCITRYLKQNLLKLVIKILS